MRQDSEAHVLRRFPGGRLLLYVATDPCGCRTRLTRAHTRCFLSLGQFSGRDAFAWASELMAAMGARVQQPPSLVAASDVCLY